jgi:serine/threonine protein kinase
MIGKTIAQYRIVEELGRGGMGSVYKAVDTQLDRTVVVKLLLRDRMSDEESRRRFVREARLASALDHPNICTIFEVQQLEGSYFIAMQYVDGETLKSAIARRPLPTPTLLSIALQIADALATAHDRGIIHRDIKPQNIMLTPRGQVKMLDCGLAKDIGDAHGRGDGEADLTEAGSPLGTPAYMAPEQIRGERVDRRADIFAFGAVLYEMATGRKAFDAKNRVDILHAVCHTSPGPIAESNRNVAPGLQAIVDRAMAKHPADRYASMGDLLADLKALAAGAVPATAVPDGINRPFVPVTKSSFWRRLLAGRAGSEPPQAPESNASSNEPAPAPVDDFPIIPGPLKSLAVLPFRSLGNATDPAWSLSLLEALIARLSEFQSLRVRPSSYVVKYLDCEIDPAEVGADLRVDAVLLGSFLRSETTLRMTTQLIDPSNGSLVWAGKVDASTTDALRLQDDICQRLVAGLTGRGGTPGTAELLADENEEIRLDAVSTLKYSRDPEAVDTLTAALDDPSPRVKAAVAEALARFGRAATQRVTARLGAAIHDGGFETARYAAKTLGLIGGAEAVPVLLEALACEHGLLAAEAALALGALGDARARLDLVDALTRPDSNVRFAATQALGQLGDARSLGALEDRLRHDADEGVRAKALWALSRIRRSGTTAMAAPAGARAEAAP